MAPRPGLTGERGRTVQRHHGLTGARTARETERAVVDGAFHQPALGGMQERAPLLEIAQLTRLEQVSRICAAPTLKDTRIRKVVGAMKVDTRVPLDDEVLRRVDDLARSLGHTCEEVIEETLRRSVAARSIRAIVERSTAASELTEDEAIRIAYEEVRGARTERGHTEQSVPRAR